MAKKKKELTRKEIAWKVFSEEYEDNEISERHERFLRNQEKMKELFNPKVEIFNEIVLKKISLESLLMETIKAGHFSEDSSLLAEIRDLSKEIGEAQLNLEKAQHEIEENANLIKKYEDWSERKLFVHWQYLKSFNTNSFFVTGVTVSSGSTPEKSKKISIKPIDVLDQLERVPTPWSMGRGDVTIKRIIII